MLTLLLISWALFAGLIMTRITNIFKLPDVTAYLLVGVIIGPSVLGRLGIEGVGFISQEEVTSLSIISDVALGFIAFAIGAEFKISNLEKVGKDAFIIGILQAVITTIVVDVVLTILHFIIPSVVTMPIVLTLGAIAAATAPAATLMVVKQYKAKGPVTNVLLPVVALDDIVGLIIFAISFGIANGLLVGIENPFFLFVEPFYEIGFSIILGIIVALLLYWIERYFHSNSNRLILIIGTIILTVVITKANMNLSGVHVTFSPLLVCMMLGTIFCNICDFSDELMERASRWSQPILVLFFVLSGAELDLKVFQNKLVIIIGLVYVISRSFGKIYGARLSAMIANSSETVKKYLGITLLPQEGVALGMSAIVAATFKEEGWLIRNIVLFGVLIYELVGPTLTKISLTKAGDIKTIKIDERSKESAVKDKVLIKANKVINEFTKSQGKKKKSNKKNVNKLTNKSKKKI